MGAGCSIKAGRYGRSNMEDHHHVDEKGDKLHVEDQAHAQHGDIGARIRLEGPSRFTSMYSQQGRKGINQDSMTVWEDFIGEKETLFCGVFDGHGPHGHKISRHVRDNLPLKLSASLKYLQLNHSKFGDVVDADDVANDDEDDDDDNDNNITSRETMKDIHYNHHNSHHLSLASIEASFVKSFKETDQELSQDSSTDTFCSGSTAVIVVKQGHHLIIANLGDSRAVLYTRGDNDQLLPIQLTVDMKPDISSEAERIKNCQGRVFAVDGEPDVYRMWMPDEDCPGLAMSRAFGDFCLKNCGLISIPEVSYRKLTNNDELVVLATDGIWDVLTNNEVIRILTSAKRRSTAANLLVHHAVRAWKSKYPGSKVDDCTAICLFLKNQPTTCSTEMSPSDVNCSQLDSFGTITCENDNESAISKLTVIRSKKELSVVEGENRSKKSPSKIPRFACFMRCQKVSISF
ncbi:hypothetical protein F2P56_008071 [Juglans regia]|uniref:PPM-type phosphatase domain-containing protein n=2 Tax=Juglans regia TaxID=51240 RepID=A0A833Y5L2_JUGRE|nr:probable protein phosphatase 2C 65 [Juglans regia]KAF5476344.1 hypothetical protein F2P56_008071 [Juglans regia]